MDAWEPLFDHALACIDSIARTGSPMPDWTFGGGTALMLRYHHRQSYDIDIFVDNPQWLPFFSPRLNDTLDPFVTDYDETASYVKLSTQWGEIDFIVALGLTQTPSETVSIHGRSVALETPAEIIAKKLRYRGASLRSRDVFDVAVVQAYTPKTLWACRPVWVSELPAIRRRLDRLATQYPIEAPRLALLPAGEVFRDTAWAKVDTLMRRVQSAENRRKSDREQ
ncbi:MAG: nucleotidyl transferase AbiEii/AbiGii toxin family protein [Firmicutes bacterium]|nr:nucleotidyl transferase AbiEii/AbiGii toxin family protein [Bacillota bacterium]